MAKQQVVALIDEDLYLQIKALAVVQQCPIGDLVDAALTMFLKVKAAEQSVKRSKAIAQPKAEP